MCKYHFMKCNIPLHTHIIMTHYIIYIYVYVSVLKYRNTLLAAAINT